MKVFVITLYDRSAEDVPIYMGVKKTLAEAEAFIAENPHDTPMEYSILAEEI